MKWISTSLIVGGEVLEKDLYSSNGTYIMAAKTVIKPGYKAVFERHGIDRIPIEEAKKEYPGQFIDEVMKSTTEQIQKVFKAKLMEADDEVKQVLADAEEIIDAVCREPEVQYNLCEIREKSRETFIHSVNVSALSAYVAMRMGVNRTVIREITIGALLHDIGYIDIPESEFDVPIDSLSEEEQLELKRHVLNGVNKLKDMSWIPAKSIEIVEKHHEYNDGSGYPFGFTSEVLPIEVMIVTVCNLFDSIIYGHFTRKMKAGEAIDMITSWAGSKLSLPVVRTFLNSIIIYPIGSTVKLMTGEIGIVIKNNSNLPLRPIISMIKDRNGECFKEQTIINLVDNMTAKILERLS